MLIKPTFLGTVLGTLVSLGGLKKRRFLTFLPQTPIFRIYSIFDFNPVEFPKLVNFPIFKPLLPPFSVTRFMLSSVGAVIINWEKVKDITRIGNWFNM